MLVQLETSGRTVCSCELRRVADIERVGRSVHQWEDLHLRIELWNFHCWRSSSLQVDCGLQLGRSGTASVRSSAVLDGEVPAVSECCLHLYHYLQSEQCRKTRALTILRATRDRLAGPHIRQGYLHSPSRRCIPSRRRNTRVRNLHSRALWPTR